MKNTTFRAAAVIATTFAALSLATQQARRHELHSLASRQRESDSGGWRGRFPLRSWHPGMLRRIALSQQTITIRELRFRPSAAVGFAFSTTISNIQINLPPALHSRSAERDFASNLGPDDNCFSTALCHVQRFTGPAAGPKDFDMVVPVHQAIHFRTPTKGNLIFHIITAPVHATYIDGWGAVRVIKVAAPGPMASIRQTPHYDRGVEVVGNFLRCRYQCTTTASGGDV